jgi:hypothetical protein
MVGTIRDEPVVIGRGRRDLKPDMATPRQIVGSAIAEGRHAAIFLDPYGVRRDGRDRHGRWLRFRKRRPGSGSVSSAVGDAVDV